MYRVLCSSWASTSLQTMSSSARWREAASLWSPTLTQYTQTETVRRSIA